MIKCGKGGETVIILGIDPGLAIVGWGILDYDKNRFRPLAYGSINTPAGMETADRLACIHHDLSAIIDHYHPTEMAVEELFFTKNITRASGWPRPEGSFS